MDELANLAHGLQDEITEARMMPIGNLYTRLSRTARDAARAAGKQVELALAGAETDLDNGIIQLISDPLIHLVRNAVAHGIETPEERAARGKPASGQVALRAYHRGNQIYIDVEDDGRGIDYEKIRSAAQVLGLVSADAALRLTERELLELLFRPSFSTASRKTELAGRGVGLDVVRSNVTALHGEISVETRKGVGTRFTLQVPLTLIITQALFLRHGAWVFGIPLACVEEIRRLRLSEIEEVGGKLLTRVRGELMEVVRIDARLGLEPVEPANGYFRLVIINVGGRQVGIIVEEVLRKDEIVIKGLGEYLSRVKLFTGATIAPDGSLILLLDVNRLVAGDAPERSLAFAGDIAANRLAAQPTPPDGAARAHSPAEKVVLLADDSISVRRFVGRMLEKAGYRVKLASDGLEALEIATQGGCDLVVSDLEMPRTNGYELMVHLRQNAATRSLPVIVLTSRAGAKHRDRALQGGAAGFLPKPVQEEQLIAAVARFLGPAGPPVPLELAPAEVPS
jgi:chemosensory pili system protein ChpA (sensor histidine kinase/response regulator)